MFSFWSNPQKSHDLILSEIRSACASSGYEVSDAVALFTINNILVVPKYKFYDETRDPQYDMVRITNLAVKDILSKSGVSLQLLNVQSYYVIDFGGEAQVLKEHAKLYDIYIEPLKKQILRSSTNPNSQTSPKVLFRQIVLYLVLTSGMGDPSQSDVYLEAECALASILSQDDLFKFIRLTKHKKLLELEELNKLLVGIRLFNKLRRLGGVGIDNMPHLLLKASSSTLSVLEEAQSKIWSKLGPLERIVELEYEWDEKSFILSSKKRKLFTPNDMSFVKHLLLLWQQISSYLSMVQVSIKNQAKNLTNIKEAMNKRLLALVEQTKCKVAIETSSIYPQFKKIYNYWKSFQNMLILLSVYNKMIKIMMQYAKVTNIPKSVIKLFSKPAIEEEMPKVIDQDLINYEVIFPAPGEDYILEFGGFCPTYALLTGGVILKARKEIGIVKINEKLYGFRDSKAAYYFCKSPELKTKQIVDMVRTKPELIEVLQMRDIVNFSSYPVAAPVPFHSKVFTTNEKSIQTELHPVDSNIDYSHRRTTWELKQDACQLANILKMRTHSMQTTNSHFLSDIGTQVNIPKEVETQTMSDNYTNTPKLQNFLYGLRGKREDKQDTIILTRPVEEGFYNIIK